MGVCEALVATVEAVVYSIADFRRVDALPARQAVERAVARGTRRADHRRTADSVVRTAAFATAAAASGTHRAHRTDTVSPSVVGYRRSAFSGAASTDTCTNETTEIACSLRD